jgi:mxaJ protein
MVPVPSGPGDLPFEFDISMGVKPGNEMLRGRLEKVLDAQRAAIARVLRDYNVPLVERKAGPTR